MELPQADRNKTVQLLRAKEFMQLNQLYDGYQRQYEQGRINDRDLTLFYQAFYQTSSDLESLLTEWIITYPDSYPARLARGIYYRKVGEEKRGGKYVGLTPRKNMADLATYLNLANQDLQISLKLTQRPIVTLLHLANTAMFSGDKEANLTWLKYANQIDPINYGIRRRYLLSLTPRWGGSYEEMWKYLEVCRKQQLSTEYLRIFESNIYLDQAKTLVEQGQRDRAFPLYRKALSLLDGINNMERLEALKGVIYNGANSQNLETFSQEIEDVLRLDPTERQILGYRGWIRIKQQRVGEGLEDYAKAAELGDPYSQFLYGRHLYFGVLPMLPANHAEAISWLRKAAEQGEERAQQFMQQVGVPP